MSKTPPVFRFAPSPNGEMHLGHAYSALLNLKLARESGGKMLLRIEDIDLQRCTAELEKQMLEDLEWIGFEWDEPPQRQSDNFGRYQTALEQLENKQLIYPTTATRGTIRDCIAKFEAKGIDWPADPDGSPHYPGNERDLSEYEWQQIRQSGHLYSLRLSMARALEDQGKGIAWTEFDAGGETRITADPSEWGDVILARKDTPASYHLCCVVDDAERGITHIVRGNDLYHSTSLHRLLQGLLGLTEPIYHHHKLILDQNGKKLSKSIKSTGLRHLFNAGYSPQDVRQMIMSDN